MKNSNLFGQRNMPEIRCKTKLVVFYRLKEDGEILYRLRGECNTVTCQYSIIPIHIDLHGGSLVETVIKRYIRNHALGYRKGLDIVCIIESCSIGLGQYVTFESIDNFATWFEQKLNERI